MESRHRTRAALLTAALALFLAVPVVPAAAHNYLRSSLPSDGDELTAPPEQVELRFDDDVLDLGTEVRLTGPAGAVDLGAATVEREVVTAAVPPDLPAGDYTVEWRVTSADGHPISGTFSFTVLPAAADPTATATASPPATSAPTASAPASPTATSGEDAAVLPEDGGASGVWLFAIPAAVLAGLAVLVARWRRGTP